MKITERRIVRQEWYETDTTKTGWDNDGWTFADYGYRIGDDWNVVNIIYLDEFGNPILGIAEREVEV